MEVLKQLTREELIKEIDTLRKIVDGKHQVTAGLLKIIKLAGITDFKGETIQDVIDRLKE